MTSIRKFREFGWESVVVLRHEEHGPYRGVTRQVLFEGTSSLPIQWRYFEIAPGGHSALERHEHIHRKLVLRGRGRCLIGSEITDIDTNDLIEVPSMEWHQFRAADDVPIGLLCVVSAIRDRPQLPSAEDIEKLRGNISIAEFIRL